MRYVCGIVLTFLIAASVSAFAQAGPKGFQVQGVVFDKDGQPLAVTNVTFKIQVLDPLGGCILYQEYFGNQDLTATNGGFNLSLGLGSNRLNRVDGSNQLNGKIFENDVVMPAAPNCPGGVTFQSGDKRMVRVSFAVGIGAMETMQGDLTVNAAPYTLVAESIQGLTKDEVLQINTSTGVVLSQQNLENIFSTANYQKLLDTFDAFIFDNIGNAISFKSKGISGVLDPIASGDLANKSYVDSHVGGGAADSALLTVLVIGDSGKGLVWDGSKWTAEIPRDLNKLPLAGGSMAGPINMQGQNILGTGRIALGPDATFNLGTFTNAEEATLVASLTPDNRGSVWFNKDLNKMRFFDGTSAVTITDSLASAGGDLVGQYPNPSIRSGAINSSLILDRTIVGADIAPGALDDSKLAGISVDKIISAPGSYFKYQPNGLGCNLGEYLIWNGVNQRWECGLPVDTGMTSLSGEVEASGNGAAVASIVDGIIGTTKLADQSVTTAKFADGSVTSGKLLNGSVTTSKLQNGSITDAQINDIGYEKLSSSAGVYLTYSPDNTPCGDGAALIWDDANGRWVCTPGPLGTLTNIATGAGLVGGPITTSGTISIATGGVTTAMIADYAVTSDHILDGGIVLADMGSNSVESSKIVDGSLITADLADGAATANALSNNSVTTQKVFPPIGTRFLLMTDSISGLTLVPKACATGQVLKWTFLGWNCAVDENAGGTVGSVVAGTGLSGGVISVSGTIRISSGGVSTSRLADDAVTSDQIANGSVTNDDLDLESVNSPKVVDGSVQTADFANSAVTDSDIATATLVSSKIADGAVTTEKICDGHVLSAKFSNLAITTPKIADEAVTTSKVATRAVTDSKVMPFPYNKLINGSSILMTYKPGDTVCGENHSLIWSDSLAGWQCSPTAIGSVFRADLGPGLDGGTITTTGTISLSSGGIVTLFIADESVSKEKIPDYGVTLTDMGEGSVDSSKIMDDSLVSNDFATNAVSTSDLAPLSVTYSKLATASVNSSALVDGSVQLGDLDSNVVNSQKIVDGSVVAVDVKNASVTTPKMPDFAVTIDKLARDSVDTTRIVDDSVTVPKLNDNAINSEKIVNGGITTIDFSTDAVTTPALADDGVTPLKLAGNSINSSKIADSSVAEIDLAPDSVNSLKLIDAGVATRSLGDGSITTPKFSGQSVTTSKIAAGSIPDVKINDVSFSKLTTTPGVYFTYKPSNTACADGFSLVWNSARPGWECSTSLAGTITEVSTGTGLTGGSITTTGVISIAAGGVSATELADDAVLSEKILDSSISLADLAVNSIDSSRIADGGVALNDLATNSVNSVKILDSSVSLADLNTGSVNSSKIIDGAVTTADLASAAISTQKVSDEQIVTSKIADGAVTDFKINDLSLTQLTNGSGVYLTYKPGNLECATGQALIWDTPSGGWICSTTILGTVTNVTLGTGLTGGTITTTGSIGIAPGGVTALELADDAVMSDKILNGSVTLVDLIANGVDSSKILDLGVALSDLASDSIDSTKIVNASISAADFGNGQVTNGKFAGSAFTTSKWGDGSVATAKLDENSVDAAKIVNASVSTPDLSSDSVDSSKILNGSVSASDFATSSIVTAKIGDDEVTTNQFGNFSVTIEKLPADSIDSSKFSTGGILSADFADAAFINGKLPNSSITNPNLADNALTDSKINDLSYARLVNKAGAYLNYRPNNSACTTGQVLAWNNATSGWVCKTDGGGTVKSITAGTGILGGPITVTGSLALDIGVGPNKIPQFDSSGRLGIGTTSAGASLDVSSFADAVGLPRGTTAQRPNSTAVGYLRYNTDLNGIEVYANSTWNLIHAGSTPSGVETGKSLRWNEATKSFDWFVANEAGQGVQSLNGDGSNDHSILVGNSGSDFNISSVQYIHTINIPTASPAARGAVTPTDWTLFNGKQTSSLANGRIWIGSTGGVASPQPASGDVVVSNLGTFTILNNAITNSKIASVRYSALTNGPGLFLNYRPDDTPCGDGQVLSWDGANSRWVCATDGGGSLKSIVAGAGLSGGTITGVGTLSIANGGVDLAMMASDSVDSSHIVNGSVTQLKMNSDSVASSALVDVSVATVDLENNAITTTKFANGSVLIAKLASNSVDASKIANGSITQADLAANSVTNAKINDIGFDKLWGTTGVYLNYRPNGIACGDGLTLVWNSGDSRWVCSATTVGTITQLDLDSSLTGGPLTTSGVIAIANGGVTSTHIANGTVVLADLNGASVDSTAIVDASVGLVDLATNSVNSAKILDGEVTTGDVGSLAVTSANINDVSYTKLSNNTGDYLSYRPNNVACVGGFSLAWNQTSKTWVCSNNLLGSLTLLATGDGLEGGPITSSGTIRISSGGVTTMKLSDDAVTAAKIPNGGINLSDLSTGSVNSTKIQNATLVLADLGTDSVGSSQLVDGTIVTVDLANDAVTSTAILDATVSLGDLANSAVDSSKIVDTSLVTADFGNAQVTSAKINTVSVAKFISGSTKYFDYAPNGLACPNSNTLSWNNAAARWECTPQAAVAAITALTGDITATGPGSKVATIATGAVTSDKIANSTIEAADFQDNGLSDASFSDLSYGKLTNLDGVYLNYKPANIDCAAGQTLTWQDSTQRWICSTHPVGTVTTLALGTGLSGGSIGSAGTVGIATGGISTAQILDGTVSLIDLNSNSVESSKIVDGAVSLADLNSNSVNSAKVVDGSIQTSDLSAAGVTNGKINDASYVKLANSSGAYLAYRPNNTACGDNFVLSWDSANARWSCSSAGTVTNIVAGTGLTGGSVSTSGTLAIASGGVTSALLADGAVSLADLGNNSVSSAALLDGSVSLTDLAADAVSSAKILDGSISTADFATGAVTSGQISEVSYSKLANGVGTYLKYKPNDVACGAGYTLVWEAANSRWICSSSIVGTATQISVSTGLTGGPISTLGTISIASGGVSGTEILDATVNLNDLGADSVTSTKFVDGEVSLADLSTGSVDSSKIANSAVATADIANRAVTDAKISGVSFSKLTFAPGTYLSYAPNNTPCPAGQGLVWQATNQQWVCSGGAAGSVRSISTNYSLSGGPITGTGTLSIASGGVTSLELAADSVTTTAIADNSITLADFAADSIGNAQFEDGAVTISDLANNAISTAKISDGKVISTKIVINSVDSSKIVDGSVQGSDLANFAVVDAKIASLSYSKLKNAPGAYLSYHPNNVDCGPDYGLVWDNTNRRWVCTSSPVGTIEHIWTSGQFVGGPISSTGTLSLAQDGVTTLEILNGTVSLEDLATDAIDSTQILDGTITLADMNSNSVNTSDIVDASLTLALFNSDSVDSSKIANGSISSADISSNTLTNAKFSTANYGKLKNGGGVYMTYMPNNAACPDNFTFVWDNTNARWVCSANPLGTVSIVATDSSLTGGPITTAGTLSIASGGVTNVHIADQTVSLVDMNGDSIDSSKIVDGAVSIADVNDLSVNSSKIVDGSVSLADMNSNAIGSNQLIDGTVSLADLNSNAVNSAKIVDGSVSLGDLAADSVNSAKISDGSIGAADIFNSQITDAKFNDVAYNKLINGAGAYLKYRPNNSACTNGYMLVWESATSRWVCSATQAGTVYSIATSAQLTGGPITGTGTLQLAPGGVSTVEIQDGTVSLADMSSNVVNSLMIVDGSVSLADMNSASVDSNKIVNGSVSLADMAANSVDTNKIVDGSIATADLGANSINNSNFVSLGYNKLRNAIGAYLNYRPNNAACSDGYGLIWDNVAGQWKCTANPLALVTNIATDSSLTGGPINTTGTLQIASGGVSASHILNGEVSLSDMGTGAVDSSKIVDGSITLDDMAANAVDSNKISDGSIGTAEIADGSLNDSHFVSVAYNKLKNSGGAFMTYRPGNTACADGYGLVWNNTSLRWQCTSATLSLMTSVATDSTLSGGPITGTGTLQIATGGVTSTHIANATVSLVDMNTGAVDSSKIVDGSVSLADMASDSVNSSKIVDGSIATGDIAGSTVTNAKFSDLGYNKLVNTTGAYINYWPANAPCTDGYGLVWKVANSRWECTAGALGTVSSVATSSQLIGGPISSTGTLQIATGGVTSTEIQDAVIVSADFANLALSDSVFSDLSFGKLVSSASGYMNYKPGNVACANNQMMAWTNSRWECATTVKATTFLAGAGAAATPSFSFSGDLNTGFYNGAAGTLSISNNSANTFNFTATNLASPTTGGSNIRHLASATGTPTYAFAGDTGTGLWRGSGILGLSTSGVERLRFSGANVGIGTTNPTTTVHLFSSSRGGDLGVQGSATTTPFLRLGVDNSANPITFLANNGYWTGSANNFVNTGAFGGLGSRLALSQGTVAVQTASGGTVPQNWVDALYADNAGLLGIGTSTPGTRLDVVGQIASSPFGTSTGETGQIRLSELAATGANMLTVRAPDAIASDVAFTLPGTAGSSSQLLSTDGTGVLSWQTGIYSGDTVIAAVGSAASPSFTFTGDTDTGFFWSAANTIGVAAAGVTYFDVSSAGLVSPTTGGADVNSAAGIVSAPTYAFAGDTSTGWWRPDASSQAASAGGTEIVRIDSSGNLGISTTSPGAKIDVTGTGRLSGGLTIGSQTSRTTSTDRGQLSLSSSYIVTSSGSTTVNWDRGNLQEVSTFICNGSNTITMSNIKDGAAYSLLLSGSANHSGNCVFSAAGFTFKTSGGGSPPPKSKDVVFTFVVINSTVVYSMHMDNLQ